MEEVNDDDDNDDDDDADDDDEEEEINRYGWRHRSKEFLGQHPIHLTIRRGHCFQLPPARALK